MFALKRTQQINDPTAVTTAAVGYPYEEGCVADNGPQPPAGAFTARVDQNRRLTSSGSMPLFRSAGGGNL